MSDLWDNPPISSRETLHGFQDQEDIVFSAVPATLMVHELRAVILSALPTTGQNGGEPEFATIYLPVSHPRALHPDTSIVIAAHGIGKSFRTAVPVSVTRRVLRVGRHHSVVEIPAGNRCPPDATKSFATTPLVPSGRV